ncbi:ABC transporter ATP-binding protein [Corynebacterium diphtheriae]|nr:ABC transporter ATP-binding protein [Corynebacterium diphtheriae]
MLRADNVTMRFGTTTVLDNITLELPRRHLLGLIGPSGSGKTTLAGLLSGRLAPTSGTVTIDNEPVPHNRTHRRTDIVSISQQPRDACNPNWTLRTIIGEPLAIAGELSTEQIARRVEECAARALLSPSLLDRLPSNVSDGQLQRACIARALVIDPAFLICDEPTSMLDPLATAAVVDLLRRIAHDGAGVLFISHDHRLLRACTDEVVQIGGEK